MKIYYVMLISTLAKHHKWTYYIKIWLTNCLYDLFHFVIFNIYACLSFSSTFLIFKLYAIGNMSSKIFHLCSYLFFWKIKKKHKFFIIMMNLMCLRMKLSWILIKNFKKIQWEFQSGWWSREMQCSPLPMTALNLQLNYKIIHLENHQ